MRKIIARSKRCFVISIFKTFIWYTNPYAVFLARNARTVEFANVEIPWYVSPSIILNT
jgi:hypothetical protein